MVVMKFGGTSVGTPARIDNVYQIVRQHLSRRPIVVVSAVGGVTDLLLAAGQNALNGKVDVAAIITKHENVIKGLNLPNDIAEMEHRELETLLVGIKMIKEISPKTSDYLVSFGERISSKFVAAYLRQKGLRAEHHFAYDIGMITNTRFQEAEPLESSYDLIHKAIAALDHIPVITGFVGKTEKGEITTLGRGGSDYTAAIIGGAVHAEEIQIWTDVDGILTTDPRMVPTALNLPVVSFQEAAELAYFGAKVLHPKTIRPAMDRDIPVVVKNTGNMTHEGTRILNNSPRTQGAVKAISVKKNTSIVSIYSLGMLDSFGFLAKIFDIFSRHHVVVDAVATSEVSVSVTVAESENIDPVIKDLAEFAQVKVEKGRAIICVVGEGLRSEAGIAARVFQAVATQKVSVDMISQGASEINITFVIDQNRAVETVKALHKLFFGV